MRRLKYFILITIFSSISCSAIAADDSLLYKEEQFDEYKNARLKRVTQYFKELTKSIAKNKNLTMLYSETCLKYISEIKEEKVKVQWMLRVADLFVDNLLETQKALSLYDKASKYYLVHAQFDELVKCYNKIGKAYFQIHNTRKAKVFFEKALNYLDTDTMNMDNAALYQNYVSVLIKLDDQDDVFDYCIKLLNYHESIKDETNIFAIKIKIGEIYLENQQSTTGIDFLSKVLEEYDYHTMDPMDYSKQKSNLFDLHFKLAKAYRGNKEYQKSLFHYNESLRIVKDQNIAHRLTRVYNAIGKTYYLNGEYESALGHLQTALMFENNGVPNHFPSSVLYGNLSICYASLSDYKKSLFYMNEALLYAENSSSLNLKKNSNNNAYRAFLIMKEYDKALVHYQIMIKNVDSIRNVLTANKFINLESKYDLIKAQRENENLIKDQEIEVLTVHNTKMNFYFLISLLLGSISITLVYLHKSRRSKILANRLAKHNFIIDKQKSEIEVSLENEKRLTNKLNEANDTLHRFFSIISHELRSPFNVILGFSEFLFTSIDTLSRKEIKTYVEAIRVSAQKNYCLTEELLTWASVNHKGLALNKEISCFKDIVDQIMLDNKDITDTKGIKIRSNISKCLKGNVDINIVKTVLSNLVTNAIKYTEKGGEILIDANKENSMICLEVSDTGVGMSSQETIELLKIDKIHSKKCSKGKFVSGMGLILCKELLRCHKGYLKVKSKKGYGTSISAFVFAG